MDPDTAVQFGGICASIALSLLVVDYLNFRKEAKKDTRDKKAITPKPVSPEIAQYISHFHGIKSVVTPVRQNSILLYWKQNMTLEEFASLADRIMSDRYDGKERSDPNHVDPQKFWLYNSVIDISGKLQTLRVRPPVGKMLLALGAMTPGNGLHFGIEGLGYAFSTSTLGDEARISLDPDFFTSFISLPSVWQWMREAVPEGSDDEFATFLNVQLNKARGETSTKE
jgi:hypothetical protein